MKLIVGLGNPGLRYSGTRHNIGFKVLDILAKSHRVRIDKKGFESFFNKTVISGEEVLLLKPQTYMNNSGVAVRAAADKFGIGPSDILVVCDDINLEFGIIRLRKSGSSGGHKGLQSVIGLIKSSDFNRLRIGIGAHKDGVLTDYVLSGFSAGERKQLKEIIASASGAAALWLEEGIEAAMNAFNVKNSA